MKRQFLILDFGSQYTWLIARSLRELGFPSEVLRWDEDLKSLKEKQPYGIVLSGGPSSVLTSSSPQRSIDELTNLAPVLAICYGMQLVASQKGGILSSSSSRTYGKNTVKWKEELIPGLKTQKVWMSHGDSIKKLPSQARLLSQDEQGLITAFSMDQILALQFHPEVSHTEKGKSLLKHYAEKMCGVQEERNAQDLKKELIEKIKTQVGGEKVFCALSGGVDSTVMAVLISKALEKKQTQFLFVDTGLLREKEYEEVLKIYKDLNLNVKGLDAKKEFLEALKGVSDPEKKRKIIGKIFIDIFKKEMKGSQYLAQGTLYPDVIESISEKGAGAVIKSHHNVGGLPKDLGLKLVEPLRSLFKDEVRSLGEDLGIPKEILFRHPFPGPGLAIRCLGEISEDKLQILRQADDIFIKELKKKNLYDKVWQAFCVLIPVRTVGVQGDGRTYDYVLSLRAVSSVDGMTADWFFFPENFLRNVSGLIVNKVRGINRVVYDITSKPPGTIEWE